MLDSTHTRFESKLVSFKNIPGEQALNEILADGWQLVTVIDRTQYCYAYFQRPKV